MFSTCYVFPFLRLSPCAHSISSPTAAASGTNPFSPVGGYSEWLFFLKYSHEFWTAANFHPVKYLLDFFFGRHCGAAASCFMCPLGWALLNVPRVEGNHTKETWVSPRRWKTEQYVSVKVSKRNRGDNAELGSPAPPLIKPCFSKYFLTRCCFLLWLTHGYTKQHNAFLLIASCLCFINESKHKYG